VAQEHVVVCAWTHTRQPISTDADLPFGWLEIPSIMVGVGDGESEEEANLHFASFDALSKWAASRALTGKLPSKSPRVWTSDRR
jgi:hypothetical protein